MQMKDMIDVMEKRRCNVSARTCKGVLLERSDLTALNGVMNDDGWRSVRVPFEDGGGFRGDDNNARLSVGDVTVADALSFPSCVCTGTGVCNMRGVARIVEPGLPECRMKIRLVKMANVTEIKFDVLYVILIFVKQGITIASSEIQAGRINVMQGMRYNATDIKFKLLCMLLIVMTDTLKIKGCAMIRRLLVFVLTDLVCTKEGEGSRGILASLFLNIPIEQT